MAQPSAPVPPISPNDRPKADRRALRGRLVVGGKRQADKGTSKSFIAAVAAHLVVLSVLIRLVTLGHGLHDWFGLAPVQPQQEHVTYVEPRNPEPKPAEPVPKPVAVKPTVQPTLTSPTPPNASPVPLEIPVDPALVAAARGGDSSGVAGNGKPKDLGINRALIGLAPANADDRLWAPGTGSINLPRTGQQMLDSVVGWAIAAAADSLDSIARLYDSNREPADWTKRMKNGEKWGWDKTGLRLGKYTVPNALLALLPAGFQRSFLSNPIEAARARSLLLAREDINRFSSQAMGEGDFRKAVKELRAKKDREYQARAQARAAENKKQPVVPPKASGGGGE